MVGKFEAGAAIRSISPDESWFQARRGALGRGTANGYRSHSFTEGVAEPIFTRTLVTRQDDHLLVLITADLITIENWLVSRVREQLGRTAGFEHAQIAVTASHTHSAPPYGEDEPYGAWITSQLVQSAEDAAADLEPVAIGATHGYCSEICYYERIPITAENAASLGVDAKHIGGIKHSRDHLESRLASGPIDPQVGVVRIDRLDGSPKIVLVHYTAHPAIEIEPPHVSPDFVGYTMKKIQSEVPGATPIFCQGAAGAVNINNIFGSLDHARRHGEVLADEVLRVLDSIQTTDEVQSAYASRSSYLEHSSIPPVEELDEEIAFCRDFLEGLDRNPDDVWLGYGPYTVNLPPGFDRDARRRLVERRMTLTEQVRGCSGEIFEPLSLELQMFRWNEIALILNPLQLFVQLGLEIKRLSRHRYTFPVCFTGGGTSPYIGPAEEVARGGYHFTPFQPARWAPGNALRLVDEMAELANT